MSIEKFGKKGNIMSSNQFASHRILLISPIPPPEGGIATWTEQYIGWSKNNKIKVDLVNTALIGSRKKNINNKSNFITEAIRTFLIIKNLKGKLRSFKPSIVHLNTPVGNMGILRDLIISRIIQKNNIKLVVNYRCNLEDRVRYKFQKKTLKLISEIADCNLVLNKKSYFYLNNITKKYTVILPNFIENKRVLRSHKIIKHHVSQLVFVGHVKESKGIKELLEVAKIFSHKTFVIIGPIDTELKECSFPLNMQFLGIKSKEEIVRVLDSSDVFIFPTHSEGFSNALLEAMARGMPIITTDVGSNLDMVENNGGIVVDPKNAIQLINAVQQIESKEIRKGMSYWNTQKVNCFYTIDIVMNKLLALYTSLNDT